GLLAGDAGRPVVADGPRPAVPVGRRGPPWSAGIPPVEGRAALRLARRPGRGRRRGRRRRAGHQRRMTTGGGAVPAGRARRAAVGLLLSGLVASGCSSNADAPTAPTAGDTGRPTAPSAGTT